MKFTLCERSKTVFKSFSSINQSIWIEAGSSDLSTIAISKSIMGKVNIDEVFPKDVGIYDISEWLAVCSLFKEAEFEFFDEYMLIGDDKSTVKYMYCEKEIVVSPPVNVNMPNADITINIEGESLSTALKAASIMSLPDVVCYSENGKVFFGVSNNTTSNSSSWSKEIGTYDGDDEFEVVIEVDSLKVLPTDYVVEISRAGITRWSSKSEAAVYHIPIGVGSNV